MALHENRLVSTAPMQTDVSLCVQTVVGYHTDTQVSIAVDIMLN